MMWDEIKSTFENEIICPSLQGRIRFEFEEHDVNEDSIVNTECFDDDTELSYSCLSIFLDDKLFYEFNSKDYYEQSYYKINARLRRTTQKVLSNDYLSKRASFEASWDILKDFIPWITSQTGMMNADHSVRIMEDYIECSFDEAKEMDNCFVSMLSLLDKRMEVETLVDYIGCVETLEPKWLRRFLKLRLEADGLI